MTKNYIEHEIKEMTKDVAPYLHNNMSPIEKVNVINQVIYELYKVKGDKKNYHFPKTFIW